MFMHKGKKGPGQDQEVQENEVGVENGENFCKCDPECKEIYDQVCSQLDICQNELGNSQKELIESKERLVRVSADLQNFQRRVEKEKIQWINVAQSELLHGILAIVDDFDRALCDYDKKELVQDVKIFLDGFLMTHKSLYKFLDDSGLKEIKQIKIFDPNLHEAISQIDSPELESGAIIAVAQKGYMFKDQVLRPAKVVVAK